MESEVEPAVPTSESESPSVLSHDQIFELLSNQRRRCVLHSLKQQNGDGSDIRELSERVAAWENGKRPEHVSADERKRVYSSLQQFHLPKMDANHVIEYDNRRGTVELTAAADSLSVYLDVVPKNDVPWSLYYAGLSALSVAFVVGVWAGIYPLTALPGVSWAVFTATVFAVSSLAHVYQNWQTRLGSEGPPPDLREQ